jgi:poly(3-hydroxybutyrate) depolymerase
MMARSAAVVATLFAGAQAGSVRYDAATHVATKSAGCGKAPPYALGRTTVATGKYAGVTWTFRVYMPSSYDRNTAYPLILQHPGWGMTAQSEEKGAGISALADKLKFISVTPQGMNDNTASARVQGPTPRQAAVSAAADHC